MNPTLIAYSVPQHIWKAYVQPASASQQKSFISLPCLSLYCNKINKIGMYSYQTCSACGHLFCYGELYTSLTFHKFHVYTNSKYCKIQKISWWAYIILVQWLFCLNFCVGLYSGGLIHRCFQHLKTGNGIQSSEVDQLHATRAISAADVPVNINILSNEKTWDKPYYHLTIGRTWQCWNVMLTMNLLILNKTHKKTKG